MTPITDYNVYQKGMKKSLEDKLFFLDLCKDADMLVDFGCADGQLLKEIHSRYPKCELYGIDMDENMIKQAKINCPSAMYTCCNTIPICRCEDEYKGVKTILNLSSVIHEIYSYQDYETVNQFWKDVFNSNYKYIAIRDMALNEKAYRASAVGDLINVCDKTDRMMIRDFERFGGSLQFNNNLIHFLLKYRYVQNWDREVRENYFPICIENLLYKIDFTKYNIIYFEHYILPFTKAKVQEDFGITLVDNTHFKLLLERKG